MTVDHDGCDPHGLLQPVCDGGAWFDSRIGIASRFANDPDSDRHGIVTPVRGVDESESLSGRAIRYLLSHRPRWANQVMVGKDTGEQQHDRPGGAKAGPPVVRSAGGFQMVLRRIVMTARSVSAARRAPGRVSLRLDAPLDDRQGRSDHEPAGRRDHRAHRQGSGRTLLRIDGGAWDAVLHAHRCARHTAGKGTPRKAVARGRQESKLAGDPITARLNGLRQQRPHRRLEGRDWQRLVRGPAVRTENIYKIYAESFRSEEHLNALVSEAREIVNNSLSGAEQS